MLSEIQIFALQFQKRCYFYMWPFIIKWNESYTRVETLSPSWKNYPWKFAFVLLFLVAILCGFVAINFRLVNPLEHFDRLNFGVMVITTGSVLATCIIAYAGMQNISEIVAAVNMCQTLMEELTQRYPARPQDSLVIADHNLILLLGVPLVAVCPFLLISTAVLGADLDVFHPIFEAYFLTDPMYREVGEILWSKLLRFLLILPVTLEEFRSIAMFGSFTIVLLDGAVTNVITILWKRIDNPREFHGYFAKAVLTYKLLEPLIYTGVYFVLSCGFWLLVGAMWVLVKGYDHIPTYLFALILIVAIFLILTYALLLPKYCKIVLYFDKILLKHRKVAEWQYARRKTKERKLTLKSVAALPPIKVKYGPFFTVEENFVVEHLYLLTQRISDAILILDF